MNRSYNGAERPTLEILHHRPELLHRIKGKFGDGFESSLRVYADPTFDWRKLEAVKLLKSHHYNCINIKKCLFTKNVSFGLICILNFSWPWFLRYT